MQNRLLHELLCALSRLSPLVFFMQNAHCASCSGKENPRDCCHSEIKSLMANLADRNPQTGATSHSVGLKSKADEADGEMRVVTRAFMSAFAFSLVLLLLLTGTCMHTDPL